MFRLWIKASSGQYVGIKVRNTKKRMGNGKKAKLCLMAYRVKRGSAPPRILNLPLDGSASGKTFGQQWLLKRKMTFV